MIRADFIDAVQFYLITTYGHKPSTAMLCIDGQYEYINHLASYGANAIHVACEMDQIIRSYVYKYDCQRQCQ